ncbi:MAG: 2-hydroxyacid dehydrogenase [Thiolinea sp.]
MQNLFIIGGITPAMQTALSGTFQLHFLQDMPDPAGWLQEHGAAVEYVLTNGHDGVKPEYMAALPNLKLISNYGVGYDAIDAKGAAARGVLVTHTPNVLNAEVATTALMLLLACYRELLSNEAHVRSGQWATAGNTPLSRSADNRTIGIVGLGRIGQAIADKLAPFNPRLLYHSRSPKDVPYEYFADLTKMAREADVLICITPGGASTHHLINQAVIEALGPEGILINVSRGSVVDEAALIDALENGKLGGAGLDVFEHEPQVPERLRALPNVVLTPHIGSATVETRAAMGQLTVDNLLQHVQGGTVISAVPECFNLKQA